MGIATYSDKSGNLNVLPSGTELSIRIYSSDYFVQSIYSTQVGNEGKFEFASLPYGVYFHFVSPMSIESNSYEANYPYYFNAYLSSSVTINYSYIDVNNDFPFTVIAMPGTVTATGDVVIKFSKAVDRNYSDCYIQCYSDFTETWSSDKKTLTLKPTTTWGYAGNSLNIWFRLYTPESGGQREILEQSFSVKII